MLVSFSYPDPRKPILKVSRSVNGYWFLEMYPEHNSVGTSVPLTKEKLEFLQSVLGLALNDINLRD